MVAAAGTAITNYVGYAGGALGPADTWAATHPNFGKVTGAALALPAMRLHKVHAMPSKPLRHSEVSGVRMSQ